MDELEGKINALFSSPESMERIMQLARSLSSSGDESAKSETQDANPTGGLGDIDPRILQILTGAMSEFSKPSEAAVLINAIKPYLSSERVEKVEKAMSIARLAKIARKVIPEFGGK